MLPSAYACEWSSRIGVPRIGAALRVQGEDMHTNSLNACTAATDVSVQGLRMAPDETGVSRSSGRPIAFGYTPDSRYICVVYGELALYTRYPVTAFEIKD